MQNGTKKIAKQNEKHVMEDDHGQKVVQEAD
jgi:hypothetical protein